MVSGGVRGDRLGVGVKEEIVLTTSQMSTQPHPFRSHRGVLERGIGREPLLSSASALISLGMTMTSWEGSQQAQPLPCGIKMMFSLPKGLHAPYASHVMGTESPP